MSTTRRHFVRSIGLSAASLTGAAIASRGLEAELAAQALGQSMPAIPAGAIRISSNENPHGPGPHVVAAVHKALGEGNRYSRTPGVLGTAVAKVHDLPAASVLMASGSGDLLRAAVLAYTAQGRPLVTGVPSYEGPVRVAEALGVPVTGVPVTAGFGLDLPAMVAAARGAGMVFLCNPNNPTGTFLSSAAVTAAVTEIRAVSPATTIVVDEAYYDCADDPAYGTLAPLAAATPGVLVLRTFSKIHGLAGLRIGYAIGHPDTLARYRLFAGQSVISNVSAAAAIASLDDTTYYQTQRRLNLETRAWTAAALTALGYTPVASQTNFLLVDVRRDVRAFNAACRAKGVLVSRPFPPLDTHARISIGTRDEMTRAMAVVHDVLAAPATTASADAGAGQGARR